MTSQQDYIQEVLQTIIDSALEAKRSSRTRNETKTAEQQAFEDGRALAFYEVVSTLVNQAKVFDLSPAVIPALAFDADKELL
ncbi:MAG: hypothetical protein NTW96_26765 [Planctomycetia bacterium]|nr:hypothetical protein [Planctomycetia bacterium]